MQSTFSSTGADQVAAEPRPGGDGAEARPLPFVLGIIGDSGSGKTTICDGVRALIGKERVTTLELDDYHRYTRAERMEMGVTALNPMVHDLSLMQEHLALLRRGRPIRNRTYDHSDGSFGPMRVVEPRDVVLVRGLLGFPDDELRSAYDLAVFLDPEPELLFRWKLRRDVRARGYAEADVLKYIAQHLLDSKQYVAPQAQRADLVVRYTLPDPEAPDSEVETRVILRRASAELLQSGPSSFERFNGGIEVDDQGADVVLHLSPRLSVDAVDEWARKRFPGYAPEQVGTCVGEEGTVERRAHLTFVQALVARLTQLLRRVEETHATR